MMHGLCSWSATRSCLNQEPSQADGLWRSRCLRQEGILPGKTLVYLAEAHDLDVYNVRLHQNHIIN